MKVQELRAAGWTIVQIAEHVGYHPATVSDWLRNGGPSARRATPADPSLAGCSRKCWWEARGGRVFPLRVSGFGWVRAS